MATKQQEKSRQTMQELMASAMELFVEKGFLETTIADITSHAGYAKGSFYRHWPSKDQLFLQITEHKLAQYRENRDQSIARAGSLEQAMRIIWDFLEATIQDRNWAKVFLEFTVQGVRTPEISAELGKSQYRLSEEIFVKLISGFVDQDFPCHKLAALNTALFEGYMVQNALGSSLTLAEARDAAITLARCHFTASTENKNNK